MTKDKRELLAGYIDNELSEEERKQFEIDLAGDPELAAELEEFRKLKELTGMVRYADLPEEVWQTYWESIYRKLERGIGWIFLSLGAIVTLCWAIYQFFGSLYADPATPLFIKISITVAAFGAVFLLVSYIRERLFAYRRDRYKEVTR